MVAVGDVLLKDHGQGVMDLIASNAVLDEAYAWLCHRRKDYSPHDDVWTLRERWANVKPRLQKSLLRGEYRCDVLRVRVGHPRNQSRLFPSSPLLLGALYLKPLDDLMERAWDLPYVPANMERLGDPGQDAVGVTAHRSGK